MTALPSSAWTPFPRGHLQMSYATGGRGPGVKPPDPLPLDVSRRFPRQPPATSDGALVWATSVSTTPFSTGTWPRERRITVTASTTSHAKKA
jgi:hypothetical protein